MTRDPSLFRTGADPYCKWTYCTQYWVLVGKERAQEKNMILEHAILSACSLSIHVSWSKTLRTYLFLAESTRVLINGQHNFSMVNTQTIFIGCTHTYHIHEHQKYMNFYLKNIRTIRVIVMNVNSGTDKYNLNLCSMLLCTVTYIYPDPSSGLLTKKFINLLKQAEDGILDLNNAAETLEVTHCYHCSWYLIASNWYKFHIFFYYSGSKATHIWHHKCPRRNWSYRKDT